MTRARLWNRFLQDRSDENRKKKFKQGNAFHLCESLKLFSKVKREKHYG